MRCQIVAELATGHGGDVVLAGDMIRAAADAGADLVKIQSYSLAKLNPLDPQRDWLYNAWLDIPAHETLMRVASDAGVELLSTPFDRASLNMLRELGMYRFKIASTEAERSWWRGGQGEFIVSWPWGDQGAVHYGFLNADGSNIWIVTHNLTAIPLYPTPLEAVVKSKLLDGWSDHCEGIAACQRAIVLGAKMIEVHFTLPGRSREKPWDKTPEQIRQLREFAEQMETIHSGVAQVYRDRWSA